MSKNGGSKAKYCIQSEKHPLETTLALCSLMEHQSLVDIAICCGSNILHAHKTVLAAISPLFREELEKNPLIEQVVITSCDFTVIRSLVEFMYCGETIITEDNVKYLLAAARMFQMRTLENLALDFPFSGEQVVLPKPQFLSKKPKYPAYPFNTTPSPPNPLKPLNYNVNTLYKPHKVKRKYRMEAEHQACVKEAQASRLAIANLKKEIASAPQANTFIIEETCTETTVENFIPHSERQNFVEVDYNTVGNPMFIPQDGKSSNVIQLTLPGNSQNLTADKIKNILGSEANSNVEIMFKTHDGNYVTVTDEVLQNLQKDGLQYQVIDENGKIGELQELQLLNKESCDKISSTNEVPKDFPFFNGSQVVFSEHSDMTIEHSKTDDALDKDIEILALDGHEIKPNFKTNDSNESSYFAECDNFKDEIDVVDDKSALAASLRVSPDTNKSVLKFSPDMFFADVNADDNDEPDVKKSCVIRKK